MPSGRLPHKEKEFVDLRIPIDHSTREVIGRLARFEGITVAAWSRRELIRSTIDEIVRIEELSNNEIE